MLDLTGRTLEVGDVVAATQIGSPSLRQAVVVKFTPRKILVSYIKVSRRGTDVHNEYKYPDQVCFIRKNTPNDNNSFE